MFPICRQKVDAISLAVPFAMQKVEGSSPFSRLSEKSLQIGIFRVSLIVCV